MGEIKLTVSDSLQVMPDKLSLLVKVKFTEESYEDALSVGTSKTEKVKEVLTKYNVEKGSIKIKSIKVEPVIDYEEQESVDSSGTRKRKNHCIISGYEYSANLSVTFDVGDERAVKLYTELFVLDGGVKVEHKYFVSDTSRYEDELLEQLVKKARRKANILATASGYKVVEVTRISQQVKQSDFDFTNSCFTMSCIDELEMVTNDIESTVQQMFDINNITPKTISDSIDIDFSTVSV